MGAGKAFETVDALSKALAEHNFLPTKGMATALFLALKLEKPLLLEGLSGCGKTELARTLAPMLSTTLIRLQCYEGIDVHEALYDWDYSKQLLHLRSIQAVDGAASDPRRSATDLYTDEYLLERPLLSALKQPQRPVLLLDELDRADVDFEAFLLEFLEEFQVTIPEVGSIKAAHAPIVIITSNRTRELHDALRRRCVYCWVDLPDPEREERILRVRNPDIAPDIVKAVVGAAARLRSLDLRKHPGVSETADWARAIHLLANGASPSTDYYRETLSAVVKDRDDLALAEANFDALIDAN
ncbi:MAG: MoxR family ATPase [Pseudomonadota bacterium]